jgi:hypothetical protein
MLYIYIHYHSDIFFVIYENIYVLMYTQIKKKLLVICSWIYVSGLGRIRKCKFDGSNLQDIITNNIIIPYGISLGIV